MDICTYGCIANCGSCVIPDDWIGVPPHIVWPMFNYIPAYEEVNDEQVLIDEEGDLVVYGETNHWPSFSYWLVPGTQEDARLWALTH